MCNVYVCVIRSLQLSRDIHPQIFINNNMYCIRAHSENSNTGLPVSFKAISSRFFLFLPYTHTQASSSSGVNYWPYIRHRGANDYDDCFGSNLIPLPSHHHHNQANHVRILCSWILRAARRRCCVKSIRNACLIYIFAKKKKMLKKKSACINSIFVSHQLFSANRK